MQRSIPTGAWLAAGLVTAALVVPGVSAAAAALTQIVGTNGTTVADVSKAHQLLTAPATPASLFSLTGNISTTATTACTSLGAIPAGKAAILRDLRFTVFTGSFTDDAVNLFANSSCSGAAIGRLGLTAGNGEMTFDPGIAIRGRRQCELRRHQQQRHPRRGQLRRGRLQRAQRICAVGDTSHRAAPS